ncbi:MAG TPA: DUF998 domain-containing protein [Candidatus Acidoferrales bacterium]|nr:DUF998 domain-containing protein [Candidatus Acidoferrales bacterium]
MPSRLATAVPTRALLLAGIVGPILFVGTFLVEGATRPDYDPVRHYVSLLSLGDGGWAEVWSFIVSGALIAAFGLGLARTWARRGGDRMVPGLIIVVGLAFVWSGVFVTDPAQGFPPGLDHGITPGALIGIPSNPTLHALLHFLGSIVTSIGLALAGILAARRGGGWHGRAARAWTAYSLATPAVIAGAWIVGLLGAGPSGPPPTAGLLQRISIVAGMAWILVAAAMELRTARAGPSVATALATD